CKQCEKWSACFQPCNDFLDAKLEYDLAKKNRLIELSLNNYRGKKIIKESTVMFDDINSIMEIDVDNPLYLLICNHLIDPRRAVDFHALVLYMQEQNKDYCNDLNLCPECRSELKEFVETEDGMPSERYWACSHGC
ncbi:MAG TPA: hypothetical protein VIM70_04205, partial [Clostridium sp.]|uniref:hypothetical protein n=1 Tax=Clostridium sp. TaxID=1506 RepID=UPI002F925A90